MPCDDVYMRLLEKADTMETESGSGLAPGLGVGRRVDCRWALGTFGVITEVPPNWNIVTITQLKKFTNTHHALKAKELLACDANLVDSEHLPVGQWLCGRYRPPGAEFCPTLQATNGLSS